MPFVAERYNQCWTHNLYLHEWLALDKFDFGLTAVLNLFELLESSALHDLVYAAEGKKLPKFFEVEIAIDADELIDSHY